MINVAVQRAFWRGKPHLCTNNQGLTSFFWTKTPPYNKVSTWQYFLPSQKRKDDMKTLKKGETSRKETITDPDGVAICHHASAHPLLSDGERFQLEWSFDFSDCPPRLVQRAAAEYCLIAKRRQFVKVKSPKNGEWNGVTFFAADLIPEPQSKAAKVLKTLAAFTPEQLAEMGIVVTSK